MANTHEHDFYTTDTAFVWNGNLLPAMFLI